MPEAMSVPTAVQERLFICASCALDFPGIKKARRIARPGSFVKD
jgi:hypothetical protein